MMDRRESVFMSWVERYRGLLFKVVRAYARTLDEQEDLFQEILLQLWRSVPNYRGEAKETTWIYRVAFNAALAWVRAQKRRRHRSQRILEGVVERQRLAPEPEEASKWAALIERLYQAIHQLPEVDASLILMRLDGVDYAEMAEVLGMTTNGVGVRLHRAQKKLGELMKGASDEL